MRTFVAIKPPESLLREIGGLTDELRRGELRGLRWVSPENIHLTLRFLGEIDEQRVGDVGEAVARAAALVEPFSMEVTKVSHFGSRRSPRVIWLGLERSEPLESLASGIEENLREAGFGSADKPFRAHITLARSKRPLRRPPDWEAIGRASDIGWPGWPVSEVLVVSSTLTPRGPVYDVVERCGLKT